MSSTPSICKGCGKSYTLDFTREAYWSPFCSPSCAMDDFDKQERQEELLEKYKADCDHPEGLKNKSEEEY